MSTFDEQAMLSTVVTEATNTPPLFDEQTTNLMSTMSGLQTNPPILQETPYSLQDLLNEQTVLSSKETTDYTTLMTLFDQTVSQLKPQLINWASAGLPNGFPIGSVTITNPAVCSDGVSRDFLGYLQYIAGDTFTNLLLINQNKFTDIYFTYSYSNTTLTLHVSKVTPN